MTHNALAWVREHLQPHYLVDIHLGEIITDHSREVKGKPFRHPRSESELTQWNEDLYAHKGAIFSFARLERLVGNCVFHLVHEGRISAITSTDVSRMPIENLAKYYTSSLVGDDDSKEEDKQTILKTVERDLDWAVENTCK